MSSTSDMPLPGSDPSIQPENPNQEEEHRTSPLGRKFHTMMAGVSSVMPAPLSDPIREAARRTKEIRRELKGLQIKKTPKTSISKPEIPTKLRVTRMGYIPGLFCEVCLQPGHAEHRCRLLKSCKLGQKLGPDYVVVCRCCWEENAHPADANVPRCAAKLYCANCHQIGDHMTSNCDLPDSP